MGVDSNEAEYAAVGDRERAALHVGERELAFLGAAAEVDDGVLDLVHAQGVGIADDGDHEAPIRAHGNPDVVEAMVDDVVAVDGRVDRGKPLQRLHRRPYEKAHEAELGAIVPIPELVAVTAAHRHHRPHVHLVEGGEHRGGLLRFHQTFGDAGSQACHGDPAFHPFA